MIQPSPTNAGMICDARNFVAEKVATCHDEPGRLHHVGAGPPDHQNNSAGRLATAGALVSWRKAT